MQKKTISKSEEKKVLEKKIKKFLRANKEKFMITTQKNAVRIIQNKYITTFYFAKKVYKQWLEEDLGIVNKTKKKSFEVTQRRFRDLTPNTFEGKNGVYSKVYDNKVLPGLLLTRNVGYLRFDNREEVIEFFDEILVAFDKIEGVED